MEYNEIFTFINLVILSITLYSTLKKNKAETNLNSTEENLNWKKLYDEAMSEIKRVIAENKEIKVENAEIKKENQDIKEMFKSSHIEVVLDIPIGGVPTLS